MYIENVADAGDVLLDAEYDEWGNVTNFTSSTGAWPIPFGFAGGLYDAETGLVRFAARDYDPNTARWTAKDPILFEGRQANLYVYAGNDPTNYVDREGEDPTAIAAGIGAFGGGTGLGAAALGAGAAGLAALGVGAAIYQGYELYRELNPDIVGPDIWYAKGGEQKDENEWTRRVKERLREPGFDKCKFLKEEYEAAKRCGDSNTAEKIKQAQKVMGCRRRG